MLAAQCAPNGLYAEEVTAQISVPIGCPSSVYFVDESGSKGSSGDFFVVAGLKTNEPDFLTRGVAAIRQRHQRFGEFKFGNLNKGSEPIFRELIELLHSSGANIGAFVIDKTVHDPFANKEHWEGHAWTVAALVKGLTTRKELATLLVDGVSTPKDVAYGQRIRSDINASFRSTRVVSAISLDSKTSDGLQLADLIASSIAHQRRALQTKTFEEYSQNRTPKTNTALYLARSFGVTTFDDIRTPRVSVRTVQPPAQRKK